MFRHIKKFSIFFFVLLLAPFLFAFTVNIVDAFIVHFGGKIYDTTTCDCSFGKVIKISDVRPGVTHPPVHVGPSSVVHRERQVRSGVWVLGNYSLVPGVCLKFSIKGCKTVSNSGTILEMGTSY